MKIPPPLHPPIYLAKQHRQLLLTDDPQVLHVLDPNTIVLFIID